MKKLFWYLLLIFVVLVMLTLILVVDKKLDNKKEVPQDQTKEKLSLLNNIDKKIDYFHYNYLDRYLDYQKKYPNLSDIDIVTRVNLGLDQPFYQNTKPSNELNKITILVNKYTYLPEDYVPNNLTKVSNLFSTSTRELVYEAKEAFEKMAAQAQEDGYTIRVISAYRSYHYQKGLYDNYVSRDGIDIADTYSARPGYSEHQTGLVVDIDNGKLDFNHFEETEEFHWMENNAYLYGFILRYPKGKEDITGYDYEAWHYRYVGKEIASFIQQNNLTFDEYYVRYIEK